MSIVTPIWTDTAETAKRVRQRISAIMRWAIAQGHRTDDPASGAITAALPRQDSRQNRHRSLPHARWPQPSTLCERRKRRR